AWEIGAAMRYTHLPVEDASRTEMTRDSTWDWRHERSAPQPLCGRLPPQPSELGRLAGNSLSHLRRRIDERRVDLKRAHGEAPRQNLKRVRRSKLPWPRPRFDRCGVGTRTDTEVNPDEPAPCLDVQAV